MAAQVTNKYIRHVFCAIWCNSNATHILQSIHPHTLIFFLKKRKVSRPLHLLQLFLPNGRLEGVSLMSCYSFSEQLCWFSYILRISLLTEKNTSLIKRAWDKQIGINHLSIKIIPQKIMATFGKYQINQLIWPFQKALLTMDAPFFYHHWNLSRIWPLFGPFIEFLVLMVFFFCRRSSSCFLGEIATKDVIKIREVLK